MSVAALHVLVIDDHEAVREEVREHLTTLGHTCAMAGSREEALHHLSGARFDYILLDLEIPTRFGRPTLLHTGHALLDEVRGAHPDLPIIVISAKDDDSHHLGMEVLRLNRASDFVRKPFPDPGKGRTLVQTIQEVLAAHARRNGHAAATSAIPKPPTRFTGGCMAFYLDRITLCDQEIAGPECGTHARCILDQLRTRAPNGDPIRKTGVQLARGSALEANEATVNGAIRDLRNRIATVLREELNLDCRPEDVIETGGKGRTGYRIPRHITVEVYPETWADASARRATKPATQASACDTACALVGLDSKDELEALGDQEREIYEALVAGDCLTNADIRKRWEISDSTVTRRLVSLRKLGLVVFSGSPRTGFWTVASAKARAIRAVGDQGLEPQQTAS